MAPGKESARLEFPVGWVRCAWCKKIVPYESGEVTLVKRGRQTVYMHPKCAHDAELADWGKEPPIHGAD